MTEPSGVLPRQYLFIYPEDELRRCIQSVFRGNRCGEREVPRTPAPHGKGQPGPRGERVVHQGHFEAIGMAHGNVEISE
jgi:hypothetical protein